MADAKSREKLEREWWARWFAEDFSWEGLAKRKWAGWSVLADGRIVETDTGAAFGARVPSPAPGGASGDGGVPAPWALPEGARPATLQDYWREEESRLVAGPDGRRWTIAHLPLAWPDGTPTGKADETWPERARLADLIAGKIAAGAETQFEGPSYARELVSADRRGQLTGAVLVEAARLPEDKAQVLHLAAAHARIRATDWSSRAFGFGAWFEGAQFSGPAGFRGAQFSRHAWFQGAQFSGDAWFHGAQFSGDAWFRGAQFSGPGWFRGAQFSGPAWFHGAQFSGEAGFRGAQFSGHARFHGAQFSSHAWFEGAQFSGPAWFEDAQFSGHAGFEGAQFSGRARFEGAEFSGHAGFESAAFAGPAFFARARFRRRVSFLGRGARLIGEDRRAEIAARDGAPPEILEKGTMTERAARVFRVADFAGAVFEGDADFSNRDFLGPS